ncbi:hypothetical protein ACFWN5_19865 [Streptomyces sp. NPDC058430]|uniref:hypothetical protein n=1 Tax=Streptomyces sp. NPDC058430 TaxID=3346495 RepID=UPI003659DC94
MNEQSAQRVIRATPQAIRTVLLQPAALPDWNPAIHSITGPDHARIGLRYRVTARGGLSGHLEYREITEDRIGLHFQVQGLREDNWSLLTPQGSVTLVQHGFSHGGPLAKLLSGAFQGVAELRLDRLEERTLSGLTAL